MEGANERRLGDLYIEESDGLVHPQFSALSS